MTGRGRAGAAAVQSVAEAAGVALILLSRSGEVTWATDAAARLAGPTGPFAIAGGRLAWASDDAAAAFESARASVTGKGRAYFRTGGLLLALWRCEAPAGPFGRPGASLAMQAFELGNVPLPAAVLQEAFGLTPAEARLAEAFAGTCDLRQAAAACGIRLETARGYLKRAMQKTECGRQAEFVRIVGRP